MATEPMGGPLQEARPDAVVRGGARGPFGGPFLVGHRGSPMGDRVWVGWDVGLVEYQYEGGRKGIAKCLVHLRMKQIYLSYMNERVVVSKLTPKTSSTLTLLSRVSSCFANALQLPSL